MHSACGVVRAPLIRQRHVAAHGGRQPARSGARHPRRPVWPSVDDDKSPPPRERAGVRPGTLQEKQWPTGDEICKESRSAQPSEHWIWGAPHRRGSAHLRGRRSRILSTTNGCLRFFLRQARLHARLFDVCWRDRTAECVRSWPLYNRPLIRPIHGRRCRAAGSCSSVVAQTTVAPDADVSFPSRLR